MKFIIYIFSITLIIFTFSCKFDSKKADQNFKTLENSLVMDSVFMEGKSVKIGDDSIKTYVKIDFPATIGNNTSVDKSIQQNLIKNQIDIIRSLFDNSNQSDLSFEDLNHASKKLLDEFKGEGKFISYDGSIDSVYMGKEAASFSSSAFFFQGGAHPNTIVNLFNFDKKNGQLINILDLVKDTIAFRAVVFKAFEKNEKSIPELAYHQDNYFNGREFRLPQNYAIKKQGLYCLYNTYEATAYVRGQIDFTIPWKDLDQIITSYIPIDDVKLGDDLE